MLLQVAKELSGKLPTVQLQVFSDRDLEPKRAQIEAALDDADVFFGSLLFDYDQVEWLKAKVGKIPVRLVFESALELMSSTQIGTFQVPLCFPLPALPCPPLPCPACVALSCRKARPAMSFPVLACMTIPKYIPIYT